MTVSLEGYKNIVYFSKIFPIVAMIMVVLIIIGLVWCHKSVSVSKPTTYTGENKKKERCNKYD